MINIMVVEDQAMVRGAISQLLGLEADINVVCQAKDGEEALNELPNHEIDLILTDIEMPNMSGLELAENVINDFPKINTVIMTTFSKSGYIKRAMSLGVKGFLLKEAPTEELITAIRQVMQGKKIIDSELALLALDDNDPLSEKERKAIKLAGDGLKTSEIAAKLYLSEGTVRNYLSEAIAKLNATNRIDAARIAKQKGGFNYWIQSNCK